MTASPDRLDVSLVAIPDAMPSTLSGLYDVFASVQAFDGRAEAAKSEKPFRVTIVGERTGALELATGLPLPIQRAVTEIERTDIVIVPSLHVPDGAWPKGRYPVLVDWIAAMHRGGATLCSACSGIFLIAETGVFDGRDATVHWDYAGGFRRAYPAVRVHPDKVLISAGARGELLSCGTSTSWYDLVLYLVARHCGAATAQALTRYLALQAHQEGLAPYMVFEAPRGHGDALVAEAQAWLSENYPVANPISEIVRRSGLAERSFKRRFTAATGLAPIAYVQRLRVEEAKRALERSRASIDEISWQVGYEDAAFFRRLFRRLTQLSPGDYRRRFAVPKANAGK